MAKYETGDVGRRQGVAAFTLTEVVIAVVLMLLALGLLLSAFVSSKRSVALAQNHLTALQLAHGEAERLLTNAYINVVPSSAILTNAFIKYTMSSSFTTNSLDTYKDVSIVVSWTNATSARLQSLTNYLTICNTN